MIYRKQLLALAGFAGVSALFIGTPANAVSVNIGLQEAGVNGGAVTDASVVAAACPPSTCKYVTSTGHALFDGTYGTFTVNTIQGSGNPPLVGGDLASSTSSNVSSNAA